jgi:DNA-binding GntR family transcriptional regulator
VAEEFEKLNDDSFMPLYDQLKEIFLEKIENKQLKEGDMIPPENELQQI